MWWPLPGDGSLTARVRASLLPIPWRCAALPPGNSAVGAVFRKHFRGEILQGTVSRFTRDWGQWFRHNNPASPLPIDRTRRTAKALVEYVSISFWIGILVPTSVLAVQIVILGFQYLVLQDQLESIGAQVRTTQSQLAISYANSVLQFGDQLSRMAPTRSFSLDERSRQACSHLVGTLRPSPNTPVAGQLAAILRTTKEAAALHEDLIGHLHGLAHEAEVTAAAGALVSLHRLGYCENTNSNYPQDSPKAVVDCENIELPNLYLAGQTLTNIQAPRLSIPASCIVDTRFDGAVLASPGFRSSGLLHVNFEDAVLSFADFSSSVLADSSFVRVTLEEGSFQNTIIYCSDFRYANFVEFEFDSITSICNKFGGSNLESADYARMSYVFPDFSRVISDDMDGDCDDFCKFHFPSNGRRETR